MVVFAHYLRVPQEATRPANSEITETLQQNMLPWETWSLLTQPPALSPGVAF